LIGGRERERRKVYVCPNWCIHCTAIWIGQATEGGGNEEEEDRQAVDAAAREREKKEERSKWFTYGGTDIVSSFHFACLLLYCSCLLKEEVGGWGYRAKRGKDSCDHIPPILKEQTFFFLATHAGGEDKRGRKGEKCCCPSALSLSREKNG